MSSELKLGLALAGAVALGYCLGQRSSRQRPARSAVASLPEGRLDYRDYTLESCTALAVSRLRACPDARLKELLASVVRNLHNCVLETKPTEEEWIKAIEFLTNVGHKCDGRRQEFILLSDVLGVSSIVEIMNNCDLEASSSTVLGPFHLAKVPLLPAGTDIAKNPPAGSESVLIRGMVRDQKGRPVAGAVLDIWHSDNNGFYDLQLNEVKDQNDMNYRGKFETDADGRYSFRTIKPKYYPIPNDGPVGNLLRAIKHHPNRPAHIHVIVAAAGHPALTTHLFPSDCPYIDNDVVFSVKKDLVMEFKPFNIGTDKYLVEFDFILAKANGTTDDPKSFVPRGSASNFVTPGK